MRRLACAALLLCACTGSARTQLLVEVHSDLFVPEELDRVAITAQAPDGRTQSAAAALGPGELPLPRVLGMVHTQGALGPYLLTVRGERSGAPVITREAAVSFVAGRTMVLRVDLVRDCIGVSCGDGETCAIGGCRSREVGQGELRDWDGTPPPLDAAAVDACGPERCNEIDDDCDGATDEGFDLGSDGENCGRCGVRCAQPHTQATCVSGSCRVDACEEPWGDCDGRADNGCETDLGSSASHCGECNNACGPPNRDCCEGTCGRC